MLIRYVIYGLSGLLIEVFWTGFSSLIYGDLTLTGHTYLWMFFIYGLAIFLEPIHNKIRRENFVVRGFIWTVLIFSIEFLTGFLLDKMIGICPWDYKRSSKLTLYGYIRLDYFPAWFIVGLLFEKYHDFLIQKAQNLFR
ncbi:putative ABC transporter permease [Caldisalinibacter kiritimatiensis]|nr:membrane protein [Caldisalinibacter kiritimatiensis]